MTTRTNNANNNNGAGSGARTTQAYRHSNTTNTNANKGFGQATNQVDLLSDLEEEKMNDLDEMMEDHEAVEVMKSSKYSNKRPQQ